MLNNISKEMYIKALINTFLYLIMGVFIILFSSKILKYSLMFIVSGFIVALANPIVKFLEKKIKIKRTFSSIMVMLFVITFVVVLLCSVFSWLLKEAINMFNSIPFLYGNIETTINDLEIWIKNLDSFISAEIINLILKLVNNLEGIMDSFMEVLKNPTIEFVSNFALSIPDIFVNIVLCLLFSYYCISDNKFLPNWYSENVPYFIKSKMKSLKSVFVDSLGKYFVSQFKIEFRIFLLLLVGFLILKIKSAGIIALIVAIADILPILGTGCILLPWSLLEILNKNYVLSIGIFIIWVLTFIVRQIIQPKIVSNSVDLPPIPTIILIFTGYYFGGFSGMIFSVPIGVILLKMKEKGFFDDLFLSLTILQVGIRKLIYYREDEKEIIKEIKTNED